MTARAKEVHHIALSVKDLEKSCAFYGDVMGLKRTLEMPIRDPAVIAVMGLRPGAVGESVYFQGPSRIGQLELIEWRGADAKDTGPKRAGDPGVFLISFEVSKEELAEIWARGCAAGAPQYAKPSTALLENYGEITVAIFEDPDGVLVELVALPSQDEIREFRRMNKEGGGT